MTTLQTSEPLKIKIAEISVYVEDAKYEFTLCDESNKFVMQKFEKFMADYLRDQAMCLDMN